MLRAPRPLNPALEQAMQPRPRRVGDMLPDGTIVCAQADGDGEHAGLHLRLLQSPAQTPTGDDTPQGRWVLRQGTRTGFYNEVLLTADRLADLYEMAYTNAVTTRAIATAAGVPAKARWALAEEMLRRLIVDHYNPEDPAEDAERMLVALGAAPRFMPASLITTSGPDQCAPQRRANARSDVSKSPTGVHL